MSPTRPKFSDSDTAADVRAELRAQIAGGASPQAAVADLEKRWSRFLEEYPEETAEFWVAFALAQWELGCLQEQTKDNALACLKSGRFAARYAGDPIALGNHEALAAHSLAILLSAQPKPRLPRPKRHAIVEWPLGSVHAYRLLNDAIALFVTIGGMGDGVTSGSPIVEVLDWSGHSLISEVEILALNVRKPVRRAAHCPSQFALTGRSQREVPTTRVMRVAVDRMPSQKTFNTAPTGASTPCSIVPWSQLDEHLVMNFDLGYGPLQYSNDA